MPEPAVTGGLEPPGEVHHIPRDYPDGTIIAHDCIFDASTLRCRVIDDAASRRSSRRPLVTSLASRRSMSGKLSSQAHHAQRHPQSLLHALPPHRCFG